METSLAALMSKWRNPTPPQPRLLLSSVLETKSDVYPRFIRTNVFSSDGGIRRLGNQLMCDGWSGGNNVEIADTTQSGHQHQHMHSNRGGETESGKGLCWVCISYCCACTSAGTTAMLHLMIFMGRIKTGRRIKCRYRYAELHTDPRPPPLPDPLINYNYPTQKP